MKKIMLLAGLCLLSQISFAQEFELDLQLRPRIEYRHGFKTLFPDNEDATTFVSQRSRINLKYGSEKLNAFVSLQNVRIWGDVTTTAAQDVNGTALHEAWASYDFSPGFSVKIGRQEINYDDARIFGNVDWAQAARSHDALVTTYQPNSHNRIDLGLALNEVDETLYQTNYTLNNYKAFQYVWYHTNFDEIGLSVLALNTGFATFSDGKQDVAYNQTLGGHITYGKEKLKADASAYIQKGKIEERSLSAYNLAANLSYQVASNFSLGVGAELLSGTDMSAGPNKSKSFNPLFGTNHKFNGLMDYFYVGNHVNSVGLLDISVPLKYQQEKITLQLVPHFFSAAADVRNISREKMDNYLGTEIDFTLGYKLAGNVDLQMGYSHMFATDSMEVLKGGNRDNTNNWAWAMIVFKPKLFSHTQQQQ